MCPFCMYPELTPLTVRYGKGVGYREIPLTYDVRQVVQDYLSYDMINSLFLI